MEFISDLNTSKELHMQDHNLQSSTVQSHNSHKKKSQGNNWEKLGYLNAPYKIFHITDNQKLEFPFHYHDFHKLLIHIRGNVSYSIEGKSYDLNPYDIVIVNAGEVHRPILNDDSIYERIIIYISKEFLDDYLDLSKCFTEAASCKSHVLRSIHSKSSILLQCISRLTQSLNDDGYANKLYQKILLLEFLIQLNRAADEGNIEYIGTYSSNGKILEIINFLNDNLTNKISIDDISSKFFLSRYHLMHTFKEETGYTIGEYITTKRLLLAREMLAEKNNHDITASEVSQKCGFGSYSSFVRAYKKTFGISPSKTT